MDSHDALKRALLTARGPLVVNVAAVAVPPGSTIGYGHGLTDSGLSVDFAGDWRAMVALGTIISELGEPVPAQVEPWQVLDVAVTAQDA